MKTLAITGGIGSGKSYIVNMFSAMGIPLYDTDRRAKELYHESEPLLHSLKAILGGDIVDRDGNLDKKRMSSLIFGDPSLLEKVESVVHPAVVEDFIEWRERVKCELHPPFVVIESAIFFEKPILHPLADKVLVVTAPLEVRVRRVMSRSQLSREEILDRIGNQWSDDKKIGEGDFLIHSDEITPLLPQVLKIYSEMVL